MLKGGRRGQGAACIKHLLCTPDAALSALATLNAALAPPFTPPRGLRASPGSAGWDKGTRAPLPLCELIPLAALRLSLASLLLILPEGMWGDPHDHSQR